jgi:hypothetical protein
MIPVPGIEHRRQKMQALRHFTNRPVSLTLYASKVLNMVSLNVSRLGCIECLGEFAAALVVT